MSLFRGNITVQQGRLRVFLGLKTSDNILVVGSEMTKQYETLLAPCDKHAGGLDVWEGAAKYSCLFLDVRRCSSKSEINQELKCAARLLKGKGILIVLTTKHKISRHFVGAGNRSVRVSIFLPFPRGSEKPNEYPLIKSAMLADFYEYGKVVCWLHKLGFYQFFHNNYIFIKTPVEIEKNTLFRKVENSLSKYLGKKCCIRIERFDARLRGALIVFISEMETGQRFIARIVTEHNTNSIVRKNQQFLQKLHSSSQVMSDIKVRIPKVVDEVDWQGSSTYIEEWIQGVLAWKVVNKRNVNTVFEEAAHFLHKLCLATSIRKILDKAMWGQLFAEDQIRFQNITLAAELQKKIAVLVEGIKKNFWGKECTFVASHGDFGYGNILLDPKSYRLTGVIDWDTGRREEFAGIDFFNLLIQQERSLGQSLYDSATTIIEQLNSDFLPHSWRNHLQQYTETSNHAMVLFGVTLLRYMSRAAQYRRVFLAEQDEYLKILQRYEVVVNP